MKAKTDSEKARAARERDMILHDEKWPCWPRLPMKHTRHKDLEVPTLPLLGVICAGELTRVYLCNVIETIVFEKTPYRQYESVDAVLADGWIVD